MSYCNALAEQIYFCMLGQKSLLVLFSKHYV